MQTETESAGQSENINVSDTENAGISETQQPETETPETQVNRVLVAYFSATNTTEGVAEHIANGLNADIYEIIPEEPYTDADLNYNDNNSRSTIEMNDPTFRPAISGSVANMDQYDIVFIGYGIHSADTECVPMQPALRRRHAESHWQQGAVRLFRPMIANSDIQQRSDGPTY